MLDGNFGGNGFRVLCDWVYLDYRAFMKTIRTSVDYPNSFFLTQAIRTIIYASGLPDEGLAYYRQSRFLQIT